MTQPWMQFSGVDASGNVEAHAAYLERLARVVAPLRQRAIELAPRVAPGGRIVGIDVSRELIERARAAAIAAGADVEFRVANVTDLPFPDATFDAARSERVFQHLTAAERAAAAAELLRVVRPGGIVQLSDPNHAQWSVAATDRELAQQLTAFVMGHARTPEAGLLNGGLLRAAGALEVETEVLPVVFRGGVADWFAAQALEGAIDGLIERGAITPERASAFVADLAARERDGVFLATGLGYLATGRVPG